MCPGTDTHKNLQVASRVENLYFTYLFTLRAVQKAAPLLQALRYSSGYAAEDDQTAQLVSKLVCWFTAYILGQHAVFWHTVLQCCT
jgi:Endoplasmic Reticulum Oxidoreductin 1 (ERO1)